MIKVNENILFYSFKYALGRMTYAVDDVAEAIIENKKELTGYLKRRIIFEINEANKEKRMGMKMDKKTWLGVVEELEK